MSLHLSLHFDHTIHALLIVLGLALAEGQALQPQSAAPRRVAVCALLSTAEIKQHLPWSAAFDVMAPEEEPIGPSGSSCSYPSVHIQVLPSSSRLVEIAREAGGLEPVAGIGDEAFFRNNQNRFAELFVKTGRYVMTLQASGEGQIEAVKPGVLSLARALVAKLR